MEAAHNRWQVYCVLWTGTKRINAIDALGIIIQAEIVVLAKGAAAIAVVRVAKVVDAAMVVKAGVRTKASDSSGDYLQSR